jgi:tetratricopeptide (TPR) repeat protein
MNRYRRHIVLLLFLLFFWNCTSQKATLQKNEIDTPVLRSYPTKAVQKFAYGELYRLAGDYGRALIEYEEAAQLDSLSPVIFARIGETYFALNRTQKARNAFQKSVNLNPDQPGLLDMIALSLALEKSYNDAEIIWKELINTHPDFLDAWYNLSDLYFENGDTEKGLNLLRKLAVREPDNSDVRGRIADILMKMGQFEEAAEYLEELIVIAPEHGTFYQVLYQAYSELGMEHRARETIERWRLNVDITPQSELLYAELLIRGEQWDEALDLLKRGSKFWPGHWAFPHLKAIVFIEKEEPDSVKKYYETALNMDSAIPVAYQNYAIWLADREESDHAMDIIKLGRSRFPESPELMFTEALLLQDKNELVLAIRVLENLRTLRPEDKNVLNILATLYDNAGQFPRAQEIYEVLIRIDENDPLTLNNYSYMLAEQNIRLELAWTMIQKALKAEPDNGAYLDTAAWILYRLKRYHEALEFIEKALMTVPGDHEVLYHKGMIILALGFKDDAIQLFEQSVKNNPDYEPARIQLEELIND